MRTILTAAVIFNVSLANAFFAPSMPSIDVPDESGWAVAMTKRACKIQIKGNVEGEILDARDGVIYNVYDQQGKVVASAWAKSTFVTAKKKCLIK